MALSRFKYDEDRESVARRKEEQGLHEFEVFGDSDLRLEENYALEQCEKNKNNHKNFIPVLEFSHHHLPGRYSHCRTLLWCIQALAQLTVRLRVHHVSNNRPDGYPGASFRNLNHKLLGSGWVYKVSFGDGPCPCRCLKPWWKVEIFTACHNVFDEKEAQRTEADLFYDSESSEVTTIRGYDVADNSVQDDVCILHCVNHDQKTAYFLEDAVRRYELFRTIARRSLMSTLCVVISHPHGMPKKVTVGELVGNVKHDLEQSQLTNFMYTYTAETCKGSSGAPVLAGVSCKKSDTTGVWPGAGPHRGHKDGENQCGSGSFYVNADLLNMTIFQDNMKEMTKIGTVRNVEHFIHLSNALERKYAENIVDVMKLPDDKIEKTTRTTIKNFDDVDTLIEKSIEMVENKGKYGDEDFFELKMLLGRICETTTRIAIRNAVDVDAFINLSKILDFVEVKMLLDRKCDTAAVLATKDAPSDAFQILNEIKELYRRLLGILFDILERVSDNDVVV